MGTERLKYSAVVAIITYLLFFYLCWIAQTDAQGGIGLILYSPVVIGLSFWTIYLAKQTKFLFWMAIGMAVLISFFYVSVWTSIGFHKLVFNSVGVIGEFIVGVPPYEWGRGTQAVHLSAREGDLSKLGNHVNQGKNVNLVNSGGETPLFFCVAGNKIEACRFLVNIGANVNHQRLDGRTALHNAATSDYRLEMVRFLVGEGANINVRDNKGKSPLALAVTYKNVAITEYLRGIGSAE